jgi:WD40 repeat protein
MIEEKWTDVPKGPCANHYHLDVRSAYRHSPCSATTNFSVCAFDADDEALVAIDNNGIIYYVDLLSAPAYRGLGYVGLSTCVAFNPKERNELFIGLSSTDVKVSRTNDINDFFLLTGHTASVINTSFYRDYCLTASNNEVIIWQTKSYRKVYQLLLKLKSIVIKKAIFSNLGHVVILYESNMIQSWMFQQFDKDNTIDPSKHGLKNVKDFEFTRDGRAMVVCGLQYKLLVFDTTTYDLLKSIELCQNYTGGRQLSLISLPLDGGANSIVAVLTSDCRLKFVSLAESNIMDSCCESKIGIKRMVVSDKGHYLAYISKNGYLEIIFLNKALNIHSSPKLKKNKEQRKSPSKVEGHLKSVHRAIKEELQLQRLLPILKEFGEYPEKHRRLIWTTIMELPSNRKAYIDLTNKVPHQAMFKMLRNDLSSDKSRNTLLNLTLSCLIHWCPVLQECLFLPKLIEPFVNVFQVNLLQNEQLINTL